MYQNRDTLWRDPAIRLWSSCLQISVPRVKRRCAASWPTPDRSIGAAWRRESAPEPGVRGEGGSGPQAQGPPTQEALGSSGGGAGRHSGLTFHPHLMERECVLYPESCVTSFLWPFFESRGYPARGCSCVLYMTLSHFIRFLKDCYFPRNVKCLFKTTALPSAQCP